MSVSRHCEFWKSTDGQWWMDLADREYAGSEDATTYGPFKSEDAAIDFLDEFSNPGSFWTDDSGTRAVPTVSPNGAPVKRPRVRRPYQSITSWR